MVLLPGLDGTEVLLQPLVASLPGWVRPVVVTYPTSGGNSYADLLALARHAVADLPDCHVLGWSFAGPLALMLAAAEPNKVRGVILSARRLPLWLFRPPTHPLRRAKSETWRRVSARVVAKRLRAIARVDARALLRDCRQPVLYIAASGPHLAMFTNPTAAVLAIGEFIAGGHEPVTPAREHPAAS